MCYGRRPVAGNARKCPYSGPEQLGPTVCVGRIFGLSRQLLQQGSSAGQYMWFM